MLNTNERQQDRIKVSNHHSCKSMAQHRRLNGELDLDWERHRRVAVLDEHGADAGGHDGVGGPLDDAEGAAHVERELLGDRAPRRHEHSPERGHLLDGRLGDLGRRDGVHQHGVGAAPAPAVDHAHVEAHGLRARVLVHVDRLAGRRRGPRRGQRAGAVAEALAVAAGDGHGHGGAVAAGLVEELGVAQAVAEGVEHLRPGVELVRPPGVPVLRHRPQLHGRHGDLLDVLREKKKNLKWIITRIVSSEYDVGDGVAAFTAGVPCPEDGADLGVVVREGHVEAAAGQEHQDDGVGRRGGGAEDLLRLVLGQEEVLPVVTLLLDVQVDAADVDGCLGSVRDLDVLADALPRRHVPAGRPRVGSVHDALGRPGVRAAQGDGAGLAGVQRQQAAVVLEEHDALPGAVEGEAPVLVGADVRLVEPRVPRDAVEVAGAHERHELVPERGVDVGLAHLALRDGGEAEVAEEVADHPPAAVGLVHLPALPAVEVEPGPDGGGAGLGAGEVEPPDVLGDDLHGVAVGDDVAVEAPVAADGLRQEARVGAGGHPVDEVEGAHDGAGVALADAHLEGAQEGLGHVALRDARVVVEARVVAPAVQVVGRVVLAAGGGLDGARVGVAAGDGDGARHVLHAAHEVDGVAAHHVGVLAGGLQRAPPPRVAHHVDYVSPPLPRLYMARASVDTASPMAFQSVSLKDAALLMTLAKTVALLTAARPEWLAAPTSSKSVAGPVLATPCSASAHHRYGGSPTRGAPAERSPRLPTFSSTVIQPMRSRTRSAYGSDASQYGNDDMSSPSSANRVASHTLVYTLPPVAVAATVRGGEEEEEAGGRRHRSRRV
ncbi:hypothetical protein U9M48_036515 [Paspalum notatum var. saurae]|uniref:Uncharacterized protein n=1 Tax=Paspalum notatum var. saurae TaxID=547442 RepID=A0AAQ3UJC7_PASNO